MGKTTGVIDTNLGIARLPMWCSVGWCGLSSRSGYCGGGRRAYGFATGSENFGRGTDPGTRVEGVACAKTTPVTAGTCTFDCMNKAIQCMGFKHKFVVTYLTVVKVKQGALMH